MRGVGRGVWERCLGAGGGGWKGAVVVLGCWELGCAGDEELRGFGALGCYGSGWPWLFWGAGNWRVAFWGAGWGLEIGVLEVGISEHGVPGVRRLGCRGAQ